MGWLQKKIINWSVNRQVDEITKFINMLGALDGAELGLTVAMATHTRHTLLGMGMGVMDPIILLAADPTATLKITRTIEQLQKSNQPMDAAALMVWAHTLRGAESLEIRGLARKMWGELSRGFPHAINAKYDFFGLSGILLNTDGYDEYPSGFTPIPL